MERQRFLLLVTLAMIIVLTGQSNAQLLFHADFENEKGANDIKTWERVSPAALIFSVENGVLKETGNGTEHATKVLVPVNGSKWTNLTVAVDRWWRDNDVLGLVLRYTGEDSYYSFDVGAGDWEFHWCLAETLSPEKTDAGLHFEDGESADKVLLKGQLEQPIDETGATAYTMAVTVSGNKMEAFFGPQIDVINKGLPSKVGEVEAKSFSKGTAGFYIMSCPSDLDNFIVYGSAGPYALSFTGKLAITWANIKQ